MQRRRPTTRSSSRSRPPPRLRLRFRLIATSWASRSASLGNDLLGTFDLTQAPLPLLPLPLRTYL